MGYLAARYDPLPDNVLVIGPDEPMNSYPLMEACTSAWRSPRSWASNCLFSASPSSWRGVPTFSGADSRSTPIHPTSFGASSPTTPLAHQRPRTRPGSCPQVRLHLLPGDGRIQCRRRSNCPVLAHLRSTDARELMPGASADLDHLVATVLARIRTASPGRTVQRAMTGLLIVRRIPGRGVSVILLGAFGIAAASATGVGAVRFGFS